MCSLEERLAQHDDNRKVVQNKLHEAQSKALTETDTLEERIPGEAQKTLREWKNRSSASSKSSTPLEAMSWNYS